jgi:hypothetical protein
VPLAGGAASGFADVKKKKTLSFNARHNSKRGYSAVYLHPGWSARTYVAFADGAKVEKRAATILVSAERFFAVHPPSINSPLSCAASLS